jgi:hypothetical protein
MRQIVVGKDGVVCGTFYRARVRWGAGRETVGMVDFNWIVFDVERGEEEAVRHRLDGGKEGGDLVLRFSFNLEQEGDGWRCTARRRLRRMAAAVVTRWETTSLMGRLGGKPKRLGPATRVSKEKMVWANKLYWAELANFTGKPGKLVFLNLIQEFGLQIKVFKIISN